MEWIDALRGSTVGLDTGPLIYYIEEHAALLDVPAGVALAPAWASMSFVAESIHPAPPCKRTSPEHRIHCKPAY